MDDQGREPWRTPGPYFYMGGAALAIAGSLMPWATALGGALSKAGTEGDGIITLIAALIGAIVGALRITGLLKGSVARILLALVGIVVAGTAIYDWRELSQAGEGISVGSGLVLTAIGGVGVLIGTAADTAPDTFSGAGGGRKVCPDCGERVAADARICRYCRHAFDDNPPADGPPALAETPAAQQDEGVTVPRSDSKAMNIALVGATVVLFVGVVTALWALQDRDDADDPVVVRTAAPLGSVNTPAPWITPTADPVRLDLTTYRSFEAQYINDINASLERRTALYQRPDRGSATWVVDLQAETERVNAVSREVLEILPPREHEERHSTMLRALTLIAEADALVIEAVTVAPLDKGKLDQASDKLRDVVTELVSLSLAR